MEDFNMEDIFEQLANNLRPSIEKIEDLRKHLAQNIQRGIIEDMGNAHTIAKLDEIKACNEVWFDEWPRLLAHYLNAAKRIKNVILTYKDILGLELLN
jgi:hypothetical protein